MVCHLATGILATSSRAGINAFKVHASKVLRAFSAHYTFRSALRWGSEVSSRARTNGMAIDLAALRIWTARGWITRVYWRVIGF